MALTATISLSQSTVGIHQNLTAQVTVSNSASVPVNVLSITPSIVSSGDPQTKDATCCTFGRPMLGPNVLVPATGTAYFSFPVVVNAPKSSPIGPQSNTFNISCVVLGADGSSVSPTAASLTVLPIP